MRELIRINILRGLNDPRTSKEEKKRLEFEMRSRWSTLGFGRQDVSPYLMREEEKMSKSCGLTILKDPSFQVNARGCLYVEFGIGVRDVKSIGWIDTITVNGGIIKISLTQKLIKENVSVWTEFQEREILINALSSVEHFCYFNGEERHFAPRARENHFSIYAKKALFAEGGNQLKEYGKLLVTGRLITQR